MTSKMTDREAKQRFSNAQAESKRDQASMPGVLGRYAGQELKAAIQERRPRVALERLSPFTLLTQPPADKPRYFDLIDDSARATICEVTSGNMDWPLVLLGETGSGKTCAGLCLHDIFGGWFADLADLHQSVLDVREGLVSWSGPAGIRINVREFWSLWEKANVTILDEIGIRSPTDAQYETFKRAIDRREGKPLVAISNLSLDGLSRVYDDRIASRLSGGTVLTLTGDRRQSGTGT